MEVVHSRPSAKILMFPLAARNSASNLGGKAKFAAELASLRDVGADFGGLVSRSGHRGRKSAQSDRH